MFEVFGGCGAQCGSQECRTSWGHCWEPGIYHSWGYYQDAWLDHQTHVNIAFHRGKYSNWAVSTYFKRPQYWVLSLLSEEADLLLMITSLWVWQARGGMTEVSFWLPLVGVLLAFHSLSCDDRPAEYLLLTLASCLLCGLLILATWGRWVWHMKLKIVVLPLKIVIWM